MILTRIKSRLPTALWAAGFVTAIAGAMLPEAQARPVSYPEAWTLMTYNNHASNAVLMHYSPTARYSVGARAEYRREESQTLGALQLNNLIKRWNMPDAQANIYLKSGVGALHGDGKTRAAAFTGVAADWENRRLFVSYENRVLQTDGMGSDYTQSARVGVAPYVAGFGDLHTWVMLEVDHQPHSKKDEFVVTPMLRFFKGIHLLEVGASTDGDVLFNYIHRF